MGIEHLRIWHWCIIGILAGAAVAYIKLSAGAPEPLGNEPVSLHVFEDHLIAKTDPDRRHVVEVRNIRVHPVGLGQFTVPGSSETVTLPYISYDVVLPRRDNPKLADVLPRITFPEFGFPKKHSTQNGVNRTIGEKLEKLDASIETEHLTLAQYLDKLNEIIDKIDKTGRYANATTVTYKYNWWESPKAMYWIYMSGGFVVIGLIFPMLVQLLTIAGYGRQRKVKDDYDLSRFKGGKEPEKAKAVIPIDAKEQLAQLEAELEAKLKAGTNDAPAQPAPAPAAPVKPLVPVLTAEKSEKPKDADAPKPVRKGYGADQGDFYPTEVHGKKKS